MSFIESCMIEFMRWCSKNADLGSHILITFMEQYCICSAFNDLNKENKKNGVLFTIVLHRDKQNSMH